MVEKQNNHYQVNWQEVSDKLNNLTSVDGGFTQATRGILPSLMMVQKFLLNKAMIQKLVSEPKKKFKFIVLELNNLLSFYSSIIIH